MIIRTHFPCDTEEVAKLTVTLHLQNFVRLQAEISTGLISTRNTHTYTSHS